MRTGARGNSGLLRAAVAVAVFCSLAAIRHGVSVAADRNARSVRNERDERFWLENMVVYHGYSDEEVAAAVGWTAERAAARIEALGLRKQAAVARVPGDALRVLPYPGGRHPRIGFLDGAIDPQRETKLSVFLPWSDKDYVVADLPEAIWCQHGLLYLAHTHVPTMWTERNVSLDVLEWSKHGDGDYSLERRLPNGVKYVALATPYFDGVAMELALTNGSDETLTDLRVQNCVMLKGADEFALQANENKLFRPPYAACRNAAGNRWIILAWEPIHRAWGNADCPCLHSDPKFPDTVPGDTSVLRGWLSFFEGDDIDAELRRLDASDWRTRNVRRD